MQQALPLALDLPQLFPSELTEANLLWKQYNDKLPKNLLREQYYDAKNLFKNLGIAVPPEFEQLDWVLGWPAKAVDKLAARIRHEGFDVPGGNVSAVEDIWAENKMDLGLRQGITSMLVHSCSFLAVTQGDTSRGEPDVLLSLGSALNSTGIWDPRLRALRSALMVTATDDYGAALELALFFPWVTIRAWRSSRDTAWLVWRIPNPTGRVLVEPLVFKPRIERPFGYSRITRAVRSITDNALRTVVRGELSAEFFSAPQRYLMGADEAMFKDSDGNPISQWEAFIGRIFAVPMYEDPDGGQHMPVAGTFPASDPNAAQMYLRGLAQQFAGETDIPVASLGVSQESNPASADAIDASRDDLVYLAEDACDTVGAAVDRLMVSAVMLRDGRSDVPRSLRKLRSQWRNPRTYTRAAIADAGQKLIAAVPWLAETEVGLARLGLSKDEIERALAERDAAQARLKASQPAPEPSAPAPDAAETDTADAEDEATAA